MKDLQTRLDEAEGNALKGGKRVIAKLEQRVCQRDWLEPSRAMIAVISRFTSWRVRMKWNNIVIKKHWKNYARTIDDWKNSSSKWKKIARINCAFKISPRNFRTRSKSTSVKSKKRVRPATKLSFASFDFRFILEEIAALNLAKYRKAQSDLGEFLLPRHSCRHSLICRRFGWACWCGWKSIGQVACQESFDCQR